jgi:acyl-lipid omega-6 desaturase (Delta-12 desaturase)
MDPTDRNIKSNDVSWVQVIKRYNFPDPWMSWWQVANSVVPYILMWVLMYYSLEISYWLTLLLSVPAAGFLVRIFIIFHDCGHGSFFKSERTNRWVGIILGALVFTPYHRWHRDHKIHHATVGNLDDRGIGDVYTITVDEYLALSRWKRFGYRFYRSPFFLMGLAPMLLFLIQFRIPKSYMTWKEKMYVHLTTLGIAVLIFGIIMVIGWKAYLLIQLPVIFIATVHGVWLFYVQHQYEDVKWVRKGEWDYKTIALQGSSFFKLPFLLRWFTGNIGYHHIHHLSPMIPNYKLPKCHDENPMFQDIKPITFFSSLRTLRMRLWDEKNQRLVGFRDVQAG